MVRVPLAALPSGPQLLPGGHRAEAQEPSGQAESPVCHEEMLSAHHPRKTDTGFTLDPANLTPPAPPAHLALSLQAARWGGTRYRAAGARAEAAPG